jgi:hypothetical protein
MESVSSNSAPAHSAPANSVSKGMAPTDNRRQNPRLMVHWRARLMVQAPKYVEAEVIDVSENGMGLRCQHRVREHQTYDFAVAIPDVLEWDRHDVVQFRAVVQSVVLSGTSFRVGVQFVSMPSSLRTKIHQWMKLSGSRLLAA